MKKIKILIVGIVISILILLGIIFFIKKEEVDNLTDNQTIEDLGINEMPETEFGEVNIENFFRVQKCIDIYIEAINKYNSAYFSVDEYGREVKIVEDDYIKENIYDLLSKNYKSEKHITVENVFNFVDDVQEKYIFNILDIKLIQRDTYNQYAVYGFLQDTNNQFIKYSYYIVNLDNINGNFSIEPIIEQYSNIEDIKVDKTEIDSNDSNIVPDINVNSEEICKEYFSAYKRMILSNPKVIYNKLDEEYRNVRFVDYNNFKEYIENNKEEIESSALTKYMINIHEGYEEYVCKDNNENIYIFDIKGVTNYTLKLDTYTIVTEKFKTEYDNSDDQNKIMMNIDKWIKMINSRDYTAAYRVLDQNFRNNNFGSEDKFEKYMREKFPQHYKVEFGKSSKEGKIYTQEIILTDITEENQSQVSNTIIMQLKDNYEFIMSFSK